MTAVDKSTELGRPPMGEDRASYLFLSPNCTKSSVVNFLKALRSYFPTQHLCFTVSSNAFTLNPLTYRFQSDVLRNVVLGR